MTIDQLTILGQPIRESTKLEAFTAPQGITEVTMTSDEVTACCPITTQRDFYIVTITYVPAAQCLESKSLKLYLASFANQGLFVEALAAKIRADVVDAIAPQSCRVSIQQKSRGGITITALAGEPAVSLSAPIGNH